MAIRPNQAAVILLLGAALLLVAAQFVRPDRTNPPIDASRTIAAQEGVDPALIAILDRSCGDCHSSATEWPSYAEVAPLSWLMAYGVTEGRETVNFSEWGAYSTAQQRLLLAQSCRAASSGSMPGVYAWLQPETRLSPQDIETICAAAPLSEATSEDESQ
jgi:hypothetical protein